MGFSGGRPSERLLFQRRRDGRERRIQVGTERRAHGDDGDRNACSQQAVLDGGRPLLIGEKIPQQCAHDLVLSLSQIAPGATTCHAEYAHPARIGTITDAAELNHYARRENSPQKSCKNARCAGTAWSSMRRRRAREALFRKLVEIVPPVFIAILTELEK